MAEVGEQLPVVLVPTKDVWVSPRNPRGITEERMNALRASLREDGEVMWARPLIVRPGGEVIAGNHRLLAALQEGWEEIPAVFIECTDLEATQIALRDNISYASWDWPKVGELLAGMTDAARYLTGFTKQETSRILDGIQPKHGPRGSDPDDAPPVPDTPDSKLGQVYELGRHRLVCGDATDPDALAEALGGATGDLMWTDPPYGVAYQSKGREEPNPIEGDDLGAEGTRALVADAMRAASALVKPGAAFYLASPAGDMGTQYRLGLLDAGLTVRQEVVWVKDRLVLGRTDYHFRHESVLYGWWPGTHFFADDRQQDTVWEIPRPSRSDLHPIMKPVELVERAIRNSSIRDEVVLDPFGGSGTTLIAAERIDRAACLVEIDPRYCDVIRTRYEEYVGAPMSVEEKAAAS